MLGGIALKTWSSTQKTVALSVGEAEYIALVKAATEAIGIRSLARDLGWQLRLVVGVDSSTAKSIASRSGIGKMRHLEAKVLWVQQAVKEKEFFLAKVAGHVNPSDVLTKPLSVSEMVDKLQSMGATLQKRQVAPRPSWADLLFEQDEGESNSFECVGFVDPCRLRPEGDWSVGGVSSGDNYRASVHGSRK